MPSSSFVPTPAQLIRELNLLPHPEGGHYRETHRSAQLVVRGDSGQTRSAATAIYYLLSDGAHSAWHRIQSDEVWHFYAGSALWFAAELVRPESYALVGCTVAPGFEFCEFELADTAALQAVWPQHEALISRLGRALPHQQTR